MIRKLQFVALLFFCSISVQTYAVPAKPIKKTVTLADGSKIEVIFSGDEHFCFYRADDGRVFRKLQEDVYERMPDDEFKSLLKTTRRKRQEMNVRRTNKAKKRVSTFNSGLYGKKRGLVILVNFSDNEFKPTHTPSFYNRYFNEHGFSDNGFMGSVGDYFLAQSYGQFGVDFDIVGPYTLPQTMAYYGTPVYNSDGKRVSNDTYPADMAWDAMKLADPDVDYSQYDWDGDGVVDQVFIIYAGYSEAQGGDENTIWPHEWSVYAASNVPQNVMLDNMYLDTYGCSSELMGADDTQNPNGIPDGIGTPCHEFSHCLGLPDIYDTSDDGNGYGMASWDVMSFGSYNGANGLAGICPSAYTSYERWVSGWLTPVEINSQTEITDMKPLTQSPEAYILYNDKKKNEYYLLENRQLDGYDRCQYGHGLLIVHVDYDASAWTNNTVNADINHQRLNLIPADNNFALNQVSDLAGDPYPGIKNNTSLTNISTPAATLFNKNTDGTYFMNKSIENISESSDGLISFIACRPLLNIPELSAIQATPNSVVANWDAIEGANYYELKLEEYSAKPSVEEALLLRETFAKAVKDKVGTKDISGSLSEYCDNTGFLGEKLFTSPYGLKIGTSTTEGYLRAPWINPAMTGELTIVLAVKPVKNAITCHELVYLNGQGVLETLEFTASSEGNVILHTTQDIPDYVFLRLSAKNMYISNMEVYDGYFTAAELGIDVINEAANTRNAAPRKISTIVTTYTTTENSYTFNDLKSGYRYDISIRSVVADDYVSPWSNPYRVDIVTAINAISVNKSASSSCAWYTINGLRLNGAPTRPGIYIRNGQKIIK